ncbi:hypothetical protein MMYC01_202505 [Madurella mycetomatis]|uniref:Uncharacterized protein n=1 Tax=Madurella mycetomatis TaxID=100816 RepID=A0A175WCM6_9PEZI|nr:hypothetical protein MMYC01_202505 [Madurella mycetomatis]
MPSGSIESCDMQLRTSSLLAGLPVEMRAAVLAHFESPLELIGNVLLSRLFLAAYEENYVSIYQSVACNLLGPRGLGMAITLVRLRSHHGCVHSGFNEESSTAHHDIPESYIDRSLAPRTRHEVPQVLAYLRQADTLAEQTLSEPSATICHLCDDSCASPAEHDCFEPCIRSWINSHALQLELFLWARLHDLGEAALDCENWEESKESKNKHSQVAWPLTWRGSLDVLLHLVEQDALI